MAKKTRRLMALVILTTLLLALVIVGQGMAKGGPARIEKLGEALYFDENLSEPSGQSCASCHEPSTGFVDPDSDLPVSEGVIEGRFGGRNSPASAYAMYAPVLYKVIEDDGEDLWIGGQFWDGRATGETLGDPLADQALGPFINELEMNNPDEATVVRDALNGEYGDLFKYVCGDGSLGDPDYVLAAYDCIALSIAAFERTELFGQFSSKYDHYLKACLRFRGDPDRCAKGEGWLAKRVGRRFFSRTEWEGFQLFMDEDPGGAMCVACHVADWTADPGNVVIPSWANGMVPPLFTDFTYDNLGVPKNPEIDALIGTPQNTDFGLGPIVGDPAQNGKFKVMTLRNIALTAPYAHNGLFESLKEITHFYNTRDALPDCTDPDVTDPEPGVNCWPAAEVPGFNVDELGNLGLSDEQEDALAEFMKTLSDGWKRGKGARK
jgi:cytochrome c peroxidase